MKMRIVFLAVVAMACGGGGGDGYTTGPGAGPGTTPPATTSGSANVSTAQSDDGYGTAKFSFAPASVTITRGGTVTWSNGNGVAHNVTFATAAGAPTNTGNFTSETVSRTFNTAGAYSYSCTNHPGMTGTGTVQ
jgi:plastocyanin